MNKPFSFEVESANFFIRQATPIALLTITLLFATVTYIFWQQYETGTEAKRMVTHTYEVRGHIRLLHARLKDAEIGQLGFLASGKKEYLDQYEEAFIDGPANPLGQVPNDTRSSIPQELRALITLTSDNASQQDNLQELSALVQNFTKQANSSIQERKKGVMAPDNIFNILRDCREITRQIRSVIKSMQGEESYLLSLRQQNDDALTEQKATIAVSGLSISYIFIVALILIYQRYREKAQAELLHYTRELERREEELQMQQEELKASNEEIEAFNEELEEKTEALEEQNAQIQQQAEELEESQHLIEEKANEIERASRYKSEFLANMSHELRTPLNSLLILAKLLAANEEGNLTEEQVEEANVIHNGGLELLSLINDILDLSKVEAGRLEAKTDEVKIEDVVKHMQQQFSPVAKDKSVHFIIENNKHCPDMFYTDIQRIEQILKNLLSNAFKFTSAGSVTLSVDCPAPGARPDLPLNDVDRIIFTVADTGIGIDPSKFSDIFEAFQQEDGSIDRRYGGTGLGLTIARKFAHMLGGDIHVSSQKGKGSRFTLILPLILTAPEVTQQMPQTPLYDPNPKRVELKPMPRQWIPEFIPDDRHHLTEKDKVMLIIEDDPNFANILMKMARKHGYKCLIAGDGKNGLLLAVEANVTAIILDLNLPDISGTMVLEQLKHSLKTRHIPVHIISGDDSVEQSLLTKGAIGYLSKPADPDDIDAVFDKIGDLLSSKIKRILVIEDDQKNQIAIQNLLKNKDLEIVIVNNGTEGLQHSSETNFDCIILDLQLPDMTGFEWLEKAEKPNVPVIIYTARELTESEHIKLNHYTGSIIIKGARSSERLLDEVSLFLHSVESKLPKNQQDIIRMQHDPDSVLKGRTILLVDDDLRNTFALSKLLRIHGIKIIIADNGQMALDKLNEPNEIDLVIMDIMMPVMDGYHAMRAIRANPAVKHLPIIALTARAMPDEQEKCIAAGANDYLTKPLDIERLLVLLRVWLFRREGVTGSVTEK